MFGFGLILGIIGVVVLIRYKRTARKSREECDWDKNKAETIKKEILKNIR